MATTPDVDAAAWLAAGSLGTVGTDIFRGPVLPYGDGVPHQAIFCLATGGPPPMPFIEAGGGTNYCWSTVQIRIRSNDNEFGAGQTKARAVRDRMHRGAISGYIEVRVREAEPNYLGQDRDGHHMWSVNAEMEHRR